jgi:hypothetical protein
VIRSDPLLHVPGAGEFVELTLAQLVELQLEKRSDYVRHYLAGVNMLDHPNELKSLIDEAESFHKTSVTTTRIGALGMWIGLRY